MKHRKNLFLTLLLLVLIIVPPLFLVNMLVEGPLNFNAPDVLGVREGEPLRRNLSSEGVFLQTLQANPQSRTVYDDVQRVVNRTADTKTYRVDLLSGKNDYVDLQFDNGRKMIDLSTGQETFVDIELFNGGGSKKMVELKYVIYSDIDPQ